eukprot:176228-Hanusia_phi.AAC.1
MVFDSKELVASGRLQRAKSRACLTTEFGATSILISGSERAVSSRLRVSVMLFHRESKLAMIY